ncbi:antifreeze protein [Celeribacter arenosi]|uniref:Antifreeze protein n=1 Tax=Celeribacter arenosi TaxID=792649 RepID=A0ABP7KCH6_9RHOB
MYPLFDLQLRYAKMVADAQAVVAMRMLGMAGFWTTRPTEVQDMIAEKQQATLRAAVAGTRAIMAGKGPVATSSAMLSPVARKVRTNRRRLTDQGPKSGSAKS